MSRCGNLDKIIPVVEQVRTKNHDVVGYRLPKDRSRGKFSPDWDRNTSPEFVQRKAQEWRACKVAFEKLWLESGMLPFETSKALSILQGAVEKVRGVVDAGLLGARKDG